MGAGILLGPHTTVTLGTKCGARLSIPLSTIARCSDGLMSLGGVCWVLSGTGSRVRGLGVGADVCSSRL